MKNQFAKACGLREKATLVGKQEERRDKGKSEMKREQRRGGR